MLQIYNSLQQRAVKCFKARQCERLPVAVAQMGSSGASIRPKTKRSIRAWSLAGVPAARGSERERANAAISPRNVNVRHIRLSLFWINHQVSDVLRFAVWLTRQQGDESVRAESEKVTDSRCFGLSQDRLGGNCGLSADINRLLLLLCAF